MLPCTDSGGSRSAVCIQPTAPRCLPVVVGVEGCNIEGVLNTIALEQFIGWLPRETVEWIQFHHLALLDKAIELAEDHLAVFP